MIRPLYKAHEPFMEVKAGFGFMGVLNYDDEADKVQCHECGNYFAALGGHIKTHKLTADAYRIKYGLNFNIALCGTNISAMRREKVTEDFVNHGSSRPRPGKGKRAAQRHEGTKTVAQQNKYGLCDLQMKTRYRIVKEIVGKIPTEADLRVHDHALYSAIERRCGTLNDFRSKIGEKVMTTADWQTKPDIELVAALRRKAKELKRIPRVRDFQKARDGYPFYGTILKRFGGWSTALRISGIGES